MEFTVPCTCGKKLTVVSSDAGTTKKCVCGTSNEIPSLSELRRQSGQASFEVGIADRLRAMHVQGLLPQGDACAGCGIRTTNTLPCTVECERPYRKGRGFLTTSALMLISPLFLWRELLGDYNAGEVHGRETLVPTPLRICPSCATTLEPGSSSIRILLKTVPLYEQLLAEYPQAELYCPQTK